MKKIVVLTGAGMSAESGISTFRDSGGLWENYDVMEVAHIDSWERNKELMLRFYNERRKQLADVEPNEGHKILAELENQFDITVITQNVDNLHESWRELGHIESIAFMPYPVENPDLIDEAAEVAEDKIGRAHV